MAVESPAFADRCTADVPVSNEPLFEQNSEHLFRGRATDLLAVQRMFPAQWMAFLRAHFVSSVHVAHFFGVTERAADKWWHGVNGPQGSKVALAYSEYPVQARAYLSVISVVAA